MTTELFIFINTMFVCLSLVLIDDVRKWSDKE